MEDETSHQQSLLWYTIYRNKFDLTPLSTMKIHNARPPAVDPNYKWKNMEVSVSSKACRWEMSETMLEIWKADYFDMKKMLTKDLSETRAKWL